MSFILQGHDFFGQASNAPGGAFLQVAVSGESACALNSAFGIQCWGNNDGNVVTQVPPASFSQVGVGCALLANSTMRCWVGGQGSVNFSVIKQSMHKDLNILLR